MGGGRLRCFPRAGDGDDDNENSRRRRRRRDRDDEVQVGSHIGNLQVGWLNGVEPVVLDCFSRESGGSALYRVFVRAGGGGDGDGDTAIDILSRMDFDVLAQPVDFSAFLAEEHRSKFEQISTSRLDPRFANAIGGANEVGPSSPSEVACEEREQEDGFRYCATIIISQFVSEHDVLEQCPALASSVEIE